MIADAIFFAMAGLDFYHAAARGLVSRGVVAGRSAFGRTKQLIDAAARRRRINQEDLKEAGEFSRNDILLKCAITPT